MAEKIEAEMLLTLKLVQRFLARNTPMAGSDHPIFGGTADRFDAMRKVVRSMIRRAEGLELTELTEEQFQQALSSEYPA